MLNKDIRATARHILNNGPYPFMAMAAIRVSVWLMMFELMKDENILLTKNLIITGLFAFAIFILSIFSKHLHIQSWIFGKGKFSYLFQPFKQKNHIKTAIPLLTVTSIMHIIRAIPTVFFFVIMIFELLGTIMGVELNRTKVLILFLAFVLICTIVATITKLAWYIWTVRPEYKTLGVLKRSCVWLARNWQKWLWFSITINALPSLRWAIVSMVTHSVYILSLLFIVIQPYLATAQAGFVYENIFRFEFGNEAAHEYARLSMADSTEQKSEC